MSSGTGSCLSCVCSSAARRFRTRIRRVAVSSVRRFAAVVLWSLTPHAQCAQQRMGNIYVWRASNVSLNTSEQRPQCGHYDLALAPGAKRAPLSIRLSALAPYAPFPLAYLQLWLVARAEASCELFAWPRSPVTRAPDGVLRIHPVFLCGGSFWKQSCNRRALCVILCPFAYLDLLGFFSAGVVIIIRPPWWTSCLAPRATSTSSPTS